MVRWEAGKLGVIQSDYKLRQTRDGSLNCAIKGSRVWDR